MKKDTAQSLPIKDWVDTMAWVRAMLALDCSRWTLSPPQVKSRWTRPASSKVAPLSHPHPQTPPPSHIVPSPNLDHIITQQGFLGTWVRSDV